jgi:hypothetical protein
MHTWPEAVPEAAERVADMLAASVRFVGVDELAVGPGFEPIGLPRPGMSLREAFATPR